MWMVSFTPRSLYPRYTLNRGLGGRGSEEKNFCQCRESNPGRPVSRLVTILTELSRFLIFLMLNKIQCTINCMQFFIATTRYTFGRCVYLSSMATGSPPLVSSHRRRVGFSLNTPSRTWTWSNEIWLHTRNKAAVAWILTQTCSGEAPLSHYSRIAGLCKHC
jgi:hypothetical protein